MFNSIHPLTVILVKFVLFFSSKFYYETSHTKKSKQRKKGFNWKGWFFFICMKCILKRRKLIEFSWDLSEILCEFLLNFTQYFLGDRLLDIPCKVCGDRSSGKHYGIYSCDGKEFELFHYDQLQHLEFDICLKDVLDFLSEVFTATGFIHVKPPVT